ncbi:uncharacterized mitochondrial protein AtMg00860-like, partial [Homarus americanus]|uniref:uncharacterized mitochondrial protein AtMg00860-like n=1 Tax=Homarus americanus TaxID=6706 RepID=UPI001C456537
MIPECDEVKGGTTRQEKLNELIRNQPWNHLDREMPSPAVFTREVNRVLAPLAVEDWVRNYLDDVIVWAPDFPPTLLQRLTRVFERFEEMGIKLNLSKCQFGHKQVKFLGHVVSERGIEPDPENVQALTDCKPPTNVKQVRQFLGMCGFYRKHVPEFAKVAYPLTELTKQTVDFAWSNECQEAFQKLKQALASYPVLVKADIYKPFELHSDASNFCVGASLNQIQEDGSLRP